MVRAGLWAWLPAALLVSGCGEEPPQGPDLLARRPDALFEHPGALVPDPEEQWGPAQLGGWGIATLSTEEGHLYVSSAQQSASLVLIADAPADRQLELLLWKETPKRGGLVTLRLNGIELGTLRLPKRPRPVQILAPKESWFWGPNVLEIESLPTTSPRAPWRPFSLARVDYGTERRVVLETTPTVTVTFPAGTGARYLVEPLDHSQLLLEAAADGAGELEVDFHLIAPETGAARTGSEESFPVVAGDFGRALVLPDAEEGMLQIDLKWTPEDGASALRLERLDLAGGAPRKQPPIVLVSIDTLAARHMSLYGYERPTTPRLEEFAEDAIVFESCQANAPWTLPSYMSVLTGLYPRSHKLDVEGTKGKPTEVWDHWQLAENRWTLAEMLRAMGYRTAAFIDTPWISTRYRLTQGFDLFDKSAQDIPKHEYGGGIDHIIPLAGEWIGSLERDESFFLFLQAIDVHAPYLPPEPWKDRFAGELTDETARMVKAGNTPFSYGAMCEYALLPYYDWGPVPTEVDIEIQVAAYDEEILALDDSFGAFLDDLKDRGVYDDALIVFTADHGEAFDHGFYGHSGTVYEPVVKVPFVVKLPGNRFGGTRVADTVQLTDLYPTIYALLTGGERDYLHGRSLLSLAAGQDSEPQPVLCEGGLIEQYSLELDGWKLIQMFPAKSTSPDAVLTHPRSPRDWVTSEFPQLADGIFTSKEKKEVVAREDFRQKLTELRSLVPGPYYELYDLRNDPDELEDLADLRPEKLAELLTVMEAEKARRDVARAHAKPIATQIEMSEEDLEQLRKLGYVED